MVNDAKSRVREINIEQYQQMKQAGDDHLLVDVREESEWAAGHAAGAMHLGKGVIERTLKPRFPTMTRRWFSTAAAAFDRHSRPITCKKWVTRT